MPGETFKEYIDSFSYGSRTDLFFKFLKNAGEEVAEQFVQDLFAELGNVVDTGDLSKMFELMYEAQLAGNSPPGEDPRWKYNDAPFTPLSKPLSEMRVGLLSSSGHHVAGQLNRPSGFAEYTQEEATKHIGEYGRARPLLSPVPVDLPQEELDVHQPGYDIRGAVRDRNTAMPIDRMKEMEAEGVIGALAPTAYSFIGLTSQMRLTREMLPEWVAKVKDDGWEAAVLVPV